MKKVLEDKSFADSVRDVVRAIPIGSILTYKQVAKRAGNEKASRAVGTVMKNNYDVTVPCHRVVRSDGVVGEYNRGGKSKKVELLKKEGVKFVTSDKVEISSTDSRL